MSVSVTVIISEGLCRRVERLAQLQQREIAQIIAEAIRLPLDEEDVPASDENAEIEQVDKEQF